MRILELFCGIGGMAAAVGNRAKIVAAVDISRAALDLYTYNYHHPTLAREIETIPLSLLHGWNADLWWLSPPCQPYTCRGRQRDVEDPRARSLLALINRIDEVQPRYIALENVPGFATSEAHTRLCRVLERCGYATREHLLCPTQLGVPMRRERFYLTAALHGNGPRLRNGDAPSYAALRRPLREFLDPAADDDPSLLVDPRVLERYAGAQHLIDREDPTSVAHCFTCAYGRSHVRSGSYLRTAQGVRRFSPQEIARLLGFGSSFRFPPHISLQKAWQLAGNSLSVDVVQYLLTREFVLPH